MPYIKEERKETLSVEGEWAYGAYEYKANKLLDEFCQGLKERKLIGSLCPGCGKVIVLPRAICGRCHRKMTERTTVSDKGTVLSYIVSPPMVKGKYKMFGVDPVELGIVKEGESLIPANVRFDGSDSPFNTLILNAKPEEVNIGMRVKVVWKKELAGNLSDIEGVEPIRG